MISSQVLPYHLDLSTDSVYTDIFSPIFESACHFSYSTSIFIVIILTVERSQVTKTWLCISPVGARNENI